MSHFLDFLGSLKEYFNRAKNIYHVESYTNLFIFNGFSMVDRHCVLRKVESCES